MLQKRRNFNNFLYIPNKFPSTLSSCHISPRILPILLNHKISKIYIIFPFNYQQKILVIPFIQFNVYYQMKINERN